VEEEVLEKEEEAQGRVLVDQPLVIAPSAVIRLHILAAHRVLLWFAPNVVQD